MENASKALIIAGAIIISIMVISLAVFVFNRMGGEAKEQANMDEEQIAAFNSKLTPYLGRQSGSQVNALIQYVISANNTAVSSKDATKAITITFPITSGNNTIQVITDASTGGMSVNYGSTGIKKVTTGANSYYDVAGEYDSNGLLTTITVTNTTSTPTTP